MPKGIDQIYVVGRHIPLEEIRMFGIPTNLRFSTMGKPHQYELCAGGCGDKIVAGHGPFCYECAKKRRR